MAEDLSRCAAHAPIRAAAVLASVSLDAAVLADLFPGLADEDEADEGEPPRESLAEADTPQTRENH